MILDRHLERRKRWRNIAILAALCLACSAPAPGAVSVCPAGGATMMTADEKSFTNVMIFDWDVEIGGQANRSAVVWSADPFVSSKKGGDQLPAAVRIAVLQTTGPVSAVVIRPTATTSAGNRAVVSAAVAGTGSVRFRLWISPAASLDLQPAGFYTAQVFAEIPGK